jgi:hypothetical protein
MMFKVAKLGIAFAAVLAWTVPAAYAGIPDANNSYYVPQSGTPDPFPASGDAPAVETEGAAAVANFRMCPNNEGGTSLPLNARIKVTLRDVNNMPIPNVAAADICILFNGGTPVQGFSGTGADSVIANSTFNTSPLCPDVRCVFADRPTNSAGQTYITFGGADPVTPGQYLRNANRKWGHYDTKLPVYALGFELSGRFISASANGTYTLRIKNYDWNSLQGLNTVPNVGAVVSSIDINSVVVGSVNPPNTAYWKDFNSSGAINSPDVNVVRAHSTHNCATPLP